MKTIPITIQKYNAEVRWNIIRVIFFYFSVKCSDVFASVVPSLMRVHLVPFHPKLLSDNIFPK